MSAFTIWAGAFKSDNGRRYESRTMCKELVPTSTLKHTKVCRASRNISLRFFDLLNVAWFLVFICLLYVLEVLRRRVLWSPRKQTFFSFRYLEKSADKVDVVRFTIFAQPVVWLVVPGTYLF